MHNNDSIGWGLARPVAAAWRMESGAYGPPHRPVCGHPGHLDRAWHAGIAMVPESPGWA